MIKAISRIKFVRKLVVLMRSVLLCYAEQNLSLMQSVEIKSSVIMKAM